MNADTERRLAAMIMEEANMMRQQAEKDGVGAYLAKPVVKARPNRQFLTAMVRGVQHANRMVDMEEMWRQRELENKASRDKRGGRSEYREGAAAAERDHFAERRNSSGEEANDNSSSSSDQDDYDGLKDEDIEKFLHSRVKRGRGAVGSRMDEPGPYRARPEGADVEVRQKEDWEARIVIRPATATTAGPSLPPGLDSRHESKKQKKAKCIQVDCSEGSDEEVKEKKRRREVKERKRKKEKRKSKDSEKHSKSKKRRH